MGNRCKKGRNGVCVCVLVGRGKGGKRGEKGGASESRATAAERGETKQKRFVLFLSQFFFASCSIVVIIVSAGKKILQFYLTAIAPGSRKISLEGVRAYVPGQIQQTVSDV